MHVLIAIALKSVLVAGLTLGLLELLKNRSAAERSWVAHIGLLALVLLAVAPLALPSLNVEAPALFTQADAPPPGAASEASPLPSGAAAAPATAQPVATTPAAAAPAISLSALQIAMAGYALPAAVLLFITLLAVGRLLTLRARADVLVDGHWLSALARAQRRMGFKHGTALLTSDDLPSPISWGLMRPVILLNSRAVEAAGDAEAIISHELAHVARLDWAKLLLSRIAVALFWFNPLVWILAREAHQLREEAADDAVLAANIADTDYAQLLVGVARHECPGLLLGAHGVAPSSSSLARRVKRVLDGSSVRGPVARSFALGVFTGAVLIAAPLAALTLTPGSPAETAIAAEAGKLAAGAPVASLAEASVPTDLPNIIAQGVSASVTTAVAAVVPEAAGEPVAPREAAIAAGETARDLAIERAKRARDALKAHGIPARDIDRLIQLKATGVTADYVAEMRAASRELARLDAGEFVGMKTVGVTPEFVRELNAAGLRNVGAEELTTARAVGMSSAYVAGMARAGVRTDIDNYIELYNVGVTPQYVTRLKKHGYVFRGTDQLVQMHALGVGPGDIKRLPPAPPAPPQPPDPHDDDGG